jgi:putative tryptophan/tyrosine transport system substrate-binding protein
MRRRTFIAGLGAAAAWPLAARAQQAQKAWKVGILWHAANLQEEMAMYQPFVGGLLDLGYVEGRSIRFYHTFADENYDRFQANAQELVAQRVDIIMASTADAAAAAAKVTRAIPIVFAASGDPVKAGLVESLPHPGGNVTGFSLVYPELANKHLEILHDVVSGLSRVAILWHPADQDHLDTLKDAKQSAKLLNIEVIPVSANSPNEFAGAFAEMGRLRANGLVVLGDSMFRVNRNMIVALAARSRLPTIYAPRDYVEVGGLISYGACIPCNFRSSATYIDKILKGAKAADLPVQQPTKFELVINQRTAKALGLTIPTSLLATADEVIE